MQRFDHKSLSFTILHYHDYYDYYLNFYILLFTILEYKISWQENPCKIYERDKSLRPASKTMLDIKLILNLSFALKNVNTYKVMME